ncbi:hypothetical protein ACOSQ2_021455 [Xanthoceras sorbifolium]
MQRQNQSHFRINLAELKAQLVKRLGPERSKLYFFYLNKLLSLELSKVEFNKFCLRIIGRENLKLHNKLIHSILKNACEAKFLPSASTHNENGYDITSSGYEPNGQVLLLSPCGDRLGICVGSDGDFSSRRSTITSNNAVSENGDLDSREIHTPVQHHQVLSRKTNNEGEVVRHHPATKNGSADGSVSVDNSQQTELLFVGNGKEPYTRSSLRPSLGIPFCSHSVGEVRQPPHVARGGRCCNSYDSDLLLGSETLKDRMLEIAVAHGLEGVSVDSANLLNSGLDVYLKRLIRSSVELVGIRSGHELMGNSIHKHHSHVKLVSYGFPGYDFPVQSSSRPLEGIHGKGYDFQLSLLDFKVAMGLKPQQLGEDWPLLLERICTCSHVE